MTPQERDYFPASSGNASVCSLSDESGASTLTGAVETMAPGGAAPCRLADDAAACFTPADALIALGIADALEPAKTPPHHDSIPVPRGSADCAGAPAKRDDRTCHPGRISITLAFDRDEQRGEHGAPGVFPYHCHILEHEDGGMMGLVTVK